MATEVVVAPHQIWMRKKQFDTSSLFVMVEEILPEIDRGGGVVRQSEVSITSWKEGKRIPKTSSRALLSTFHKKYEYVCAILS